MKKAIAAVTVLLVGSSAAWAKDTPLANGSFETDTPATGFGQTISNWNMTFTPTQAANALAANQVSGLFTTFGAKYPAPTVPNGAAFAVLTNLGYGTVRLQSSAPGGPAFQVIDRNLAFRYVYVTNDPASAATHDNFQVQIDFFTTAAAVTSSGQILLTVANTAGLTDSGMGFSPFGGASNPATFQFNNSVGTGTNAFNLFNVNVSQFFGQFARVTFIVDNGNATTNTNGNGLGVSGVLLDNVLLNPEPSTMALFALGVAGLGGFAWKKRSAAKKPTA